jgi:hypothetical protein
MKKKESDDKHKNLSEMTDYEKGGNKNGSLNKIAKGFGER